MNIQRLVAEEMLLQESRGFRLDPLDIPPFPRIGAGATYHDKVHLPRISKLAHTIIVPRLADLAEIFDVVGQLSGSPFKGKDATIKHEKAHGEASKYLTGKERYAARLAFGPRAIVKGRTMRQASILPMTIMDDVDVTILGVGVMLAAPNDSGKNVEDTQKLASLGLTRESALTMAKQINKATNTRYYPNLS